MKLTKVFAGNTRLKDLYVGATKWQVFKFKALRLFRRVALVIIAIDVIGWAGVAGYYYAKSNIAPELVRAEVIKEVPTTVFPPMLKKICTAESGWKQFKANGDVVRGKVNPSDIGICQINEYINNDEARRLGYDIYTEQGNKDFAVYLFNNRGVQPWESSRCGANGWDKTSKYCK